MLFRSDFVRVSYEDFTADANGTASFAFAAFDSGKHNWELRIEHEASLLGSIGLGNKELAAKVYNVSRHWTGTAFARLTKLATMDSDYTAQDGEVLTGTLASTVKISIAHGATVTLNDVTINGVSDLSYNWAGITCLGDAHIILSGVNSVKGFYEDYPGIQAGPAGKTLTISGTGSLTATNNGYAAGIGGGYGTSCGNIVINGGEIEATGGTEAGAGIGSSTTSCGNITINGGTVTAYGGSNSAAIGSGAAAALGEWGSCGNISITGGTVTAYGYANAAAIGSAYNGVCGHITIGAGITSVKAVKGGAEGSHIGGGAGTAATCGAVSIDASLTQTITKTYNTNDTLTLTPATTP